jgi:hypothetical protein
MMVSTQELSYAKSKASTEFYINIELPFASFFEFSPYLEILAKNIMSQMDQN